MMFIKPFEAWCRTPFSKGPPHPVALVTPMLSQGVSFSQILFTHYFTGSCLTGRISDLGLLFPGSAYFVLSQVA